MRKKLLSALLLALSGCGGGSSDLQTGFAAFVTDQIAATADDTDPVPVNDLDFPDADSEDETLFADLLD